MEGNKKADIFKVQGEQQPWLTAAFMSNRKSAVPLLSGIALDRGQDQVSI